MSPLDQTWADLGKTLGLPHKSLTGLEILAALLIIYAVYLLLSSGILYLSFSFLDKAVPWSQVLTTVIIRDLIFLPLGFFAFGIGYFFAFLIWIGLLKYRFKLEWGRATLIAIVAELLPATLTIVVIVSFFATIIFFASLFG